MPFPNIDPIAFSIGPLPIRWYSLAYLSAAVVGALYLMQLMKRPALWNLKKQGPLTTEQLIDVATIAALGAIIGGRLGYVIFYEPGLLIAPWESLGSMIEGKNLIKTLLGWLPIPPALMMWRGGMSFHGGLIGVSVAGYLFARQHKLDALVLGDLFACAAPLGLFFGRLANFINGELYGRPSDVSWAMIFPADPLGLARHPSQLYEAALEGLLLFFIIFITTHIFKFLRYKGATIGILLMGYGISRIIIENFREPDSHLNDLPLGLTMGMILSTPMVMLGAWLILRAFKKDLGVIEEAKPQPTQPSKPSQSSGKSKKPSANR